MKYYFYPQSIFTCVTAFSDLFNDIGIRVYDTKTNEIVGYKPVPVTISPKEKIAHILNASSVNDVDPQVDNYLPRISISPPDITPAFDRNRGKQEKRLLNIEYDDNSKKRSIQIDTQSIPVNYTFEVSLWTKYLIDMNQLLENIIPWFSPELYVSFKERNFGIEHKSRIILTNSSKNFVYEYGENDKRILQWNLSFSMDGVMYKPLEITKEILCATIYIAGVPCKKTPFYGDKIVAYEPITNGYESILTKSTNLGIYQMDASDNYDQMVKYWRVGNSNMNPPEYNKCSQLCNEENIGDRPEWSQEFKSNTCEPVLTKPCIQIDPTTQDISSYWKEQKVENNSIKIISWLQIYDKTGNIIKDSTTIDISSYPNICYPVYTEVPVITSYNPTSNHIIPDKTVSHEIPDVTECSNPEYYTSG